MKKIAFTTNASWNNYNFRLGVMKALMGQGYKVVSIAPKDKYTELLESEGVECKDIYIDNRGTNPINDLKTTKQFYKIFKEMEIDFVFNYTIKPCIYGSIAAKLAGIKSISVITGLGYVFIREDLVQKIVRLLYRFSLNLNEEVWFLNSEDKELFEKYGIINSKDAISILPGSGVDTKKFKAKVSILKSEGINTQKFTTTTTTTTTGFLLIARMLWDKGVGEYVEAARIIKSKYLDTKFYLLGFLGVDNPSAISKEQMDAWVAEGVVEYLGVSDKVHEEIAKVDCVVLPSYYREGVPRVLLEAASMEKPIITTDNVGCRDVVDDGINGFLCKVKDAKDLADKMEKMINLSPEERIAMGKAGREKMIREFDERIVIDKYIKTIKQLIG